MHKTGKLAEAKIYYLQLLNNNFRKDEVLHLLGTVEFELKNFISALNFVEESISINFNNENAHSNRGLILQNLNMLNESLNSFDEAISINPNFFEAYSNRGNVLNELKRFDQAIESYNKSIAINPNYAKAYYNLGCTYKKINKLKDAIYNFDKALEIDPNYINAIIHKSSIELLKGNFKVGMTLSERRFELKSSGLFKRNFNKPRWTGKENLKNKKILLISEQGLGDIIQYCRYVTLLKNLGAIVIFEVPKKLIPLLSSLDGVALFVEQNKIISSYDFYCPLLSLPLAFNTDLTTIPNNIPYLSVAENLKFKWKNYIGLEGFKIGICWQGNKASELDKGRNFPVRLFESISNMKNVRLISLQKNDGIEQLNYLSKKIRIEKLPDDFDENGNSFLDTAAVMNCLDLIITSDTSLTHLAGALGVDTWLVLQLVPHSTWLLNTDKSSWYPRHKLFRQKQIGDWESVFEEIKDQLQKKFTK